MVMELDYDRSLHGQEHEAGPFHVTDEQIASFSEGIGETNPVHTDVAAALAGGFKGLVAPPTFPTVLVRGMSLPDIKLKFGRTQMHAGQRIQSRAPIVAGDTLIASSHLKDVYPKTGRSGTMVFVVWETTFRNQDGVVVADVQESYASRE
jgi:acyl dehydratase